jgi:geranylgeranyl pyrophosphate synthase
MSYNEKIDCYTCDSCGLCFDYEDDYLEHEVDCKEEELEEKEELKELKESMYPNETCEFHRIKNTDLKRQIEKIEGGSDE